MVVFQDYHGAEEMRLGFGQVTVPETSVWFDGGFNQLVSKGEMISF